MRTHSDIIVDAGGPAAVARSLDVPGVLTNNVKSWRRNNSIPAPYWRRFADCRFATLTELANAVARAPAAGFASPQVTPRPLGPTCGQVLSAVDIAVPEAADRTAFPASSPLVGSHPFTMRNLPVPGLASQAASVWKTDKCGVRVGQPDGELAVAE